MKEYKLSKLVIIVVTLLFLTSVHCVVLAIGGRLIGFLNLTIGRAHVCTPVTFRNLVCRLLLEKKKGRIDGAYSASRAVAPRSGPTAAPSRRRGCAHLSYFFFNDPATTEIYTNLNTLSLHDALPI